VLGKSLVCGIFSNFCCNFLVNRNKNINNNKCCRAFCWLFLRQRIDIAVQHGNATSILGTNPRHLGSEDNLYIN